MWVRREIKCSNWLAFDCEKNAPGDTARVQEERARKVRKKTKIDHPTPYLQNEGAWIIKNMQKMVLYLKMILEVYGLLKKR